MDSSNKLKLSYEEQCNNWSTFATIQVLLMWCSFLGKILLHSPPSLVERMMFKWDFLFFCFDVLAYFWIYQSFRFYEKMFVSGEIICPDNEEEICNEFQFYCTKLIFVMKMFIGIQLVEKLLFFFIWNNESLIEFVCSTIVIFFGYFLLDWKFLSMYIEQILIRNQ